MSDVHRIRLEGFWKPDGNGVSRSFGRPRTIAADEVIEVVGSCSRNYRIFVNLERIGEGTAGGFRCSISMPLQVRNAIRIETEGDVNDVALEIRHVASTNDLNEPKA